MSDPHAPFTLYKMDVSYFSGKLECYLRYKGVPFSTVTADARTLDLIYARTGVKKVPAVETADGLWLFDTTPTIDWFEEQYPANPVLPDDPAEAFLARLIEDYADEWLWRPAMWWRWEPLPSRKALGWRIALEVDPPGIPHQVMARFFAWRQRRTWLWGDGMHAGNAAAVRDLYLHELDFLSDVLGQRPFLLGDSPSLADFGYFASMFRHFGNDPDPAEIMRRRAPVVYEWLARLWNSSEHDKNPSPHFLPAEGAAWAPLWQRICGDYLPYLQQNAQAWAIKRTRFDSTGASLCFPGTVTHRYRVWCLQQLQRQFQALGAHAQQHVQDRLSPHGGLGPLTDASMTDSGLDSLYRLPRAAGQYRQPARIALLGQPRN